MTDRTLEGVPADPTGYVITYVGKKLAVTRLTDGKEIGRYETRDQAVQAAEDDRATA